MRRLVVLSLGLASACGGLESVELPNVGPTASLVVDRAVAEIGVEVLLDGSASVDPDGHIVSYRFVVPGEPEADSAAPTLQRAFTHAGRYQILLVVTDEDGAAAEAEATVTIVEPYQPTCHATSCQVAMKDCGILSDGCGRLLDCGGCQAPEVCGGGGIGNVCGAGVCTPADCPSQGTDCGYLWDGCGGLQDCGLCPGGETCGGGGPNVCGAASCVPRTCAELGAECGPVLDGCGGVLECGGCEAPAECGAGGVPNLCATAGMVIVDAGPFLSGCTAAMCEGLHSVVCESVTLAAFEIDRHEVTQVQYQDCVAAGACSPPSCDWVPVARPDHPVVCVRWEQAVDYCEWRGKRLPTEAEWEKAARGSDARTFPWGELLPSCALAVSFECSETTRPVGSVPAGVSPSGALDMIGNASEWVADWFVPDEAPPCPAIDPQGPPTGTEKLIRGGSFETLPWRTWDFARTDPASAWPDLGFRCARSLP